jgi:uncharacterized protein
VAQVADEGSGTADAGGCIVNAVERVFLRPIGNPLPLGQLVAVAVLGTTALRFACTGMYELTASKTWEDIAGVVGLALFAIAMYAALAMALEEARRTTVLPTGRRGAATHVVDEPGIRPQL